MNYLNNLQRANITFKADGVGRKEPRVIKYWPDRKEIYVGHSQGLISVFNAIKLRSGPIRILY